MSLSIRLKPIAQKELAFGSIGAAYMGVGTAFEEPIRILLVQNLTDQLLQFSLDGIEDHFPLAANGYILLDVTANKTREQGYYVAEGTRVYVKEVSTPTAGSVYVSAFYGAQ